MNYSGYFIDKDGNKYLPYKELDFSLILDNFKIKIRKIN